MPGSVELLAKLLQVAVLRVARAQKILTAREAGDTAAGVEKETEQLKDVSGIEGKGGKGKFSSHRKRVQEKTKKTTPDYWKYLDQFIGRAAKLVMQKEELEISRDTRELRALMEEFRKRNQAQSDAIDAND